MEVYYEITKTTEFRFWIMKLVSGDGGVSPTESLYLVNDEKALGISHDLRHGRV
jgi:hypothetical protein